MLAIFRAKLEQKNRGKRHSNPYNICKCLYECFNKRMILYSGKLLRLQIFAEVLFSLKNIFCSFYFHVSTLVNCHLACSKVHTRKFPRYNFCVNSCGHKNRENLHHAKISHYTVHVCAQAIQRSIAL